METNSDEWSYHQLSSSWTHPSGLMALVDPIPTSSGAIRCVGPLSEPSSTLSTWRVMELMTNLTLQIESLAKHRGCYVAWGTYRKNHPVESQRLNTLGRDYFFTANIALRSRLLRLTKKRGHQVDEAIGREWSLSPKTRAATHRSGTTFEVERTYGPFHSRMQALVYENQIDQALINRSILEESISCLAFEALHLLNLRPLTRSTVIRRLGPVAPATDNGTATR